MPVVNGFYCRDGTEIDIAKKGVNPAKPHPELAPAALEARRKPDAVTAASKVALGDNRPVAVGDQGRRLNLYA